MYVVTQFIPSKRNDTYRLICLFRVEKALEIEIGRQTCSIRVRLGNATEKGSKSGSCPSLELSESTGY